MMYILFFILNAEFYKLMLCYDDNNFDLEKTFSKAPLPEFRKRVEEINDEETPPVESTEDPSQNIVSFLIQNVKEIFKDTYDSNDEEDESQTNSVNYLRRMGKLDEDSDSSGNIQHDAEMVADVVENESDSTKHTSHTDKNYEAITKSNDFNFKLLKGQEVRDNEVNMDFKPNEKLEKHFFKNEPDSESQSDDSYNDVELQDYRKSTLLFRPMLEIATTQDHSIDLNIENKLSTLINSNTDFSNFSDTISYDGLSSSFYSNESLIDEISDVNSLPFLVNRKIFQPVTKNVMNTGKGLMFIAGHGPKTKVVRTTKSIKKPTRTTTRSPGFTVDFESILGKDGKEPKRSCIRCNNAENDWCGSPKNKLIPSAVCKIDGDVCYSMHTPFGIVERGCFNINHNMSTYVCGCNLCNYVAFTDMPVIFGSKQDWIQNVFELSHMRSLTKTTMKRLSCLKCEVNGTVGGNAIYNTNCLEGHLGVVPNVKCQEDEICGVRTAKNLGYIWRGCVSAPLYNFYITLCDSDLCNYDPIASIYDKND